VQSIIDGAHFQLDGRRIPPSGWLEGEAARDESAEVVVGVGPVERS
jgi:hypothetical protein